MNSAGIDCGAKTAKAVILHGDTIVGKAIKPAGLDTRGAAEHVYREALKDAGISPDDIGKVVATGVGKQELLFKDGVVSEVGADARGIHFLLKDIRTVIDVGAEEARAIRIDSNGRVVDFAINEKCAAGTGAFAESMARILELSLDDFGRLSLESTEKITINAQCVVFAESDVVSLVHGQVSKPNMARAINNAIAERIVSMARRVGIEKEVAVIGGVSKNVGFVRTLEEALERRVVVPEDPEFIGALGAAFTVLHK